MRTRKCYSAVDETMLLHLKGKGVNIATARLCVRKLESKTLIQIYMK